MSQNPEKRDSGAPIMSQNPEKRDSGAPIMSQNPEKRDSGESAPLQISADSLEDSSSSLRVKLIKREEEEERDQNPKKRDSESLEFQNIRAVCIEKGIRDPKASVLAALVHVTPELVRGHVDAALGEGNPIGTAIHRIQFDWPVPEAPQEVDTRRGSAFDEYLMDSDPSEQISLCSWTEPTGATRKINGVTYKLRTPFCKEPIQRQGRFCPEHQKRFEAGEYEE